MPFAWMTRSRTFNDKLWFWQTIVAEFYFEKSHDIFYCALRPTNRHFCMTCSCQLPSEPIDTQPVKGWGWLLWQIAVEYIIPVFLMGESIIKNCLIFYNLPCLFSHWLLCLQVGTGLSSSTESNWIEVGLLHWINCLCARQITLTLV